MTRRWLNSADVEIDETTGAILVRGDSDTHDGTAQFAGWRK